MKTTTSVERLFSRIGEVVRPSFFRFSFSDSHSLFEYSGMFCMGSGLLVVDDVLALEAGHSWAVIGAPLLNVSRFSSVSTEPSNSIEPVQTIDVSRAWGLEISEC